MPRYEIAHKYGFEIVDVEEADIDQFLAKICRVDWYVYKGKRGHVALHSQKGANILSIARIDPEPVAVARASKIKKAQADNELDL